jgi:sialic acid synthase SpsE
VNIEVSKPYVIAEIGGNHNGDMDLAKRMIDVAKECGADAVKFQLYDIEDLQTQDYLDQLNRGIVKLENVAEWSSKESGLMNIYDQVKKYSIQESEHIDLFQYCRTIGIDYSSTAVTTERVTFLAEQRVSFIKVASMDINNIEFILHCISTELPVLISTGLASLGEIENVVNAIPPGKKSQVTFLHCTSLYPPNPDEINLKFITTMKNSFGVNVGYSDHSLGYSVSLAAVALGAAIIEKHFTLDKNMPGWDHKVSANPDELRIICEQSKVISECLGSGSKKVSSREFEKRLKFRRSATTTKKIKAGEVIKKTDIVYKRPGSGVNPDEEKYLIGRVAKYDMDSDHTITFKDLI